MEKIVSFIRSAWYNIVHDRLYSVFYVLGTAIAFIFIIILLQAMRLLKDDAEPFVNAGRTVCFDSHIYKIKNDPRGNYTLPYSIVNQLYDQVDLIEAAYMSHIESAFAVIDDKVRTVAVNFTTPNYFNINRFEFIEGKPFEDVSSRHAVITKDIADKYYDSNALGEKIEIQNVEYEIVGIVENYSSLSNPLERAKVWISIQYNRFVPSADWDDYSYVVLCKENVPMDEFKGRLKHFFDMYYSKLLKKDVDVSQDGFRTIQEIKEKTVSGEVLRYSLGLIILLLLVIPALNIMTLSMSNTWWRSKEIAIRRVMGATRFQSFIQIIAENFILVLAGLFVALLLVNPVMKFIESMFFDLTAEASFISASSLDWFLIGISMLVSIIFTILSGGFPAYLISRKNISSVLKGRES